MSGYHFNTKVTASEDRYFDPIKRHYFRTSNLFVVAPDCGRPFPNKVLPRSGRYFDINDRHYYKIGNLYGIDPCQSDCPKRFDHNRPLCIDNLSCTDPTRCDDVFYNERDCFYYKLQVRS